MDAVLQEKRKEVINSLMTNNVLVTDTLLDKLNTYTQVSQFDELLLTLTSSQNPSSTSSIVSDENQPERSSVIIPKEVVEPYKKRDVGDFVSYFNVRYSMLQKFIQTRKELVNLMSLNRIIVKRDKEKSSFIGTVVSKQISKQGNLILKFEDPTERVMAVVHKNHTEVFAMGQDLSIGDTVGVTGSNAQHMFFVNGIVLPDVPIQEIKKGPNEVYALFLSDVHVGSNNFLEDKFMKFLSWLKGETGSASQKKIPESVKYIFIIGDLVDGVGIYPNQESELLINDIYEQYAAAAKLLSQIPKHIKIVILPGNHDAVRLAEPQPALYEDIAKPLWDMPNVIMAPNPCLVNIEKSSAFSGFDVLLYHGYSFDHYVAQVESIRLSGGYDRADLIMKYLLQRRHLAPAHKSTLYMPNKTSDPLVITKIPDVFASGHIHKSSAANYKGITMISGSCWQETTEFQKKVGHTPEPARVPALNLKTRKVKILRF